MCKGILFDSLLVQFLMMIPLALNLSGTYQISLNPQSSLSSSFFVAFVLIYMLMNNLWFLFPLFLNILELWQNQNDFEVWFGVFIIDIYFITSSLYFCFLKSSGILLSPFGSYLSYTSQVISQSRTKIKLNKVFFPYWFCQARSIGCDFTG